MPRVLFVAACSKTIGVGHFRRSLTLAEAIVDGGGEAALLIAGELPTTMSSSLPLTCVDANVSRPTAALEHARRVGADLVLVDDYAWTAAQLQTLRQAMLCGAIDDLADRPLEVDVLINGGAARVAYPPVADQRLLLGPKYALLRPAFRATPRFVAVPIATRVLVTMGGADPLGLTSRVVRIALDTLPAAQLDVVIGPLARGTSFDDLRVHVHLAPPDLSPLMRNVDLAISAGGQTLYELAATGVPTIAIEVAANQRPNLDALAAASTLAITENDLSTLADQLRNLATDASRRQRFADAGQTLIDGRGALRAAEALLALIQERSERQHG